MACARGRRLRRFASQDSVADTLGGSREGLDRLQMKHTNSGRIPSYLPRRVVPKASGK